jgi:hypothetical protein
VSALLLPLKRFAQQQLDTSRRALSAVRFALVGRNRPKIFVIGLNKTGTTTLAHTLHLHGLRVGDQSTAERLAPEYLSGQWEPILAYCTTAQVFQDFPFSFPETYKQLDKAFPNAKFILSVRDSAAQWYASRKAHDERLAKRAGLTHFESIEDLKQIDYVYPGWGYDLYSSLGWSLGNSDAVRAEWLERYEAWTQEVRTHFADRPGKLLEVNVGVRDDYRHLCTFLGLRPKLKAFPVRNASRARAKAS